MTKQFLLTGALNDGKPQKYLLGFSEPATSYFAFTDRSGPIAYRTRSQGEPQLIVLTNRGPLRILTKNIGLEPPPNIVVIDEQRSSVIARYYNACIDLSFLKNSDAIWDEGRGRCISLRANDRGAPTTKSCTKPKATACRDANLPADFEPARGKTIEQLDSVLRDIRALRLSPNNAEGTHFGGGGWSMRAYRVARTPYLVLIGQCGDCDE